MALLSLPTQLLIMIRDLVTDPVDLVAFRLAHPHLNAIAAEHFDRLFPDDFEYTTEYDGLDHDDCKGCVHAPIPTELEDDHNRMDSRDAMLFHATTRRHIRHLRDIMRLPFPRKMVVFDSARPLPLVHNTQWVGWQESIVLCSRNGWRELLGALLAKTPQPLPGIWVVIPIHQAIMAGHIWEATMLVQAGMPADINSEEHGGTAFKLARPRGHRGLAQLMYHCAGEQYPDDLWRPRE